MRISSVATVLLGSLAVADPNPSYQLLPSLREQAVLQDKWTAERRAAIPKLLQKHKIDAWLVCPPHVAIVSHSNSLSTLHKDPIRTCKTPIKMYP